MIGEAERYEQLQIGAEFLATLAQDSTERTTHLKMAGHYWLRAQRAGSSRKPDRTH